tara:strand:- start:11123 stop:11341 length:219 start_codon:yes stop_codon:yes gene_type:complete
MGLRQKIKDAVPQNVDHALVVYVNSEGLVTAGLHGEPNKCAEALLALMKNDEVVQKIMTAVVKTYEKPEGTV